MASPNFTHVYALNALYYDKAATHTIAPELIAPARGIPQEKELSVSNLRYTLEQELGQGKGNRASAAAGAIGLKMDPWGAVTLIGRNEPSLAGMSSVEV